MVMLGRVKLTPEAWTIFLGAALLFSSFTFVAPLMIVGVYAQETNVTSISPSEAPGVTVNVNPPPTSEPQTITDELIGQAIIIVGSVGAAAASALIGFLRSKGLRISEEQEKYFVETVKGLVQKQARRLYQEVKNNPDLFSKGIYTPEMGGRAKQALLEDVSKIIQSEDFKGFSKKISADALNVMVEKYVSEEHRIKWKLTEETISKFVDVATAGVAYAYNRKEKWNELSEEERKKLEDEVLSKVKNLMDEQMLLFSDDAARVRIVAALGEKLSKII